MARLSPLRNLTPAGSSRRQSRDASVASISSMERALRTLSPSRSPALRTPRPNNGNGQRTKRPSSKSSAVKPNSSRSSNSSEEAVKVAIRVRPLAPGGDQCAGRAWRASSERNAIVEIPGGRRDDNCSTPARRKSGESEYNYDKVFGEDTNTCEIYNELVSDMVESATKEGINGTVFTYGQTASGKTFSMQGSGADSSIGIIQLAAKDIFQSIKEERSEDSNTECSVRVSYVEIYNEELRDLLHDNKRKTSTSLIIREDKQGSILVEGLKEVAVKSLEQLMEVFRTGEANKSVGSTKMNDRSSRSHAILKIILERKTVLHPAGDVDDKENVAGSNNAPGLVVKTTSALNLVDLAGSESVRHTGASGMQKKEGGMINQSLLTLSKVLMSLGQKNPGHINYRDSKLTRILKPSLSGNARMAVVCCISPSGKYVEETRSTLQFATRAKLVKTNAVSNEEVEDADLIATLRLESAKSKWENRKLEDKLRNMEKINSNALATERELANLKKFVISEKKSKDGQQSFTDEHINLSSRNIFPLLESAANQPASKDDLHVRFSSDNDESSSNGGNILRVALDFKAKQVKNLQAKLGDSKPGISSKAKREKRYSLISAIRSPDSDRRMSRINEGRSPDVDRRTSYELKSFSNQTEIEQLESKLANANSLIEGLERQIDDTTSQKNDALDWIEELFSKSDHLDEKISMTCEARDEARRRCEELEQELSTTKELLTSGDLELTSQNEKLRLEAEDSKTKMGSLEAVIESLKGDMNAHNESADKIEELYLELATSKEKYETVHDSLSRVRMENRQLLQDKRDADNKQSELEAEIAHLTFERDELENVAQSDSEETSGLEEKAIVELKSQVHELEVFTNEYAEEKKSLIQQIETYEEEKRSAGALLKTKSDALDDAIFSLDTEKKSIEKMKSNATWSPDTEELNRLNDENVALIEENETLKHDQAQLKRDFNERCQKGDDLSSELSARQHEAKFANEEVDLLREESEKLRAEKLRLAEDYDECVREIGNLSNELREAHQQLDDAKLHKATLSNEEADVLIEDSDELRAEHLQLTEDYNECKQKMSNLSNELNEAHQQLDGAKLREARLTADAAKLMEDNDKLRAEKFQMTEDCTKRMQRADDLENDLSESRHKAKLTDEDANVLIEDNNQLRADKLQITDEYDECMQKLSEVTRQLDDAKQRSEEAAELKEDNDKLRAKLPRLERLAEDYNTYRRKMVSEARSEARRQLDDVAEVDGLKAENDRLRSERHHLTNDFDECCHKMDELSNELRGEQKQLRDATEHKEKAVNRLDAANAKIKELFGQIQVTKKELKLQEKAKSQLRESVSRVQHLVDALSSENANLKEKNESYEMARECLENRSHELQCLLSTATSERDVAFDERINLMKSNANLSSKFKKLSSERDAALREKESVRMKLDKIAADFEADYETVRSKVDKLLMEKKSLEDKLMFLEASKTSVEDNADRILERDNAIAGKYDRLKVEFKKQSMGIAELQDEIKNLVKRVVRVKSENERISRDNRALKDIIQTRSEASRIDESNDTRRVIFGFRGKK